MPPAAGPPSPSPQPDRAGSLPPSGLPSSGLPASGLRPLQASDLPQLAEVYRDAVRSQAQDLYSPDQVRAWAAHAVAEQGAFRDPLLRGYGLVSCGGERGEQVEAFALLDPPDRLALLYCRGRSSRQGRATALLQALQSHAFSQGVGQLRTEASQLSRPLLERQGWRVKAEETAWYDGVPFQRWRMVRDLP